jgi:hypothetical protein
MLQEGGRSVCKDQPAASSEAVRTELAAFARQLTDIVHLSIIGFAIKVKYSLYVSGIFPKNFSILVI